MFYEKLNNLRVCNGLEPSEPIVKEMGHSSKMYTVSSVTSHLTDEFTKDLLS